MDDLVTVTLLRHGVTQANLEKRYLGWTDVPLTEAAKQDLLQAHCFGEQFDLAVTSDLLRAKQTAEILCPLLKRIETKAFREMNFGEWEMKAYDDLQENSFYRAWIDAPEKITPLHGESFLEMTRRVDVGFEQLKREAMQRGSKNILLVSHGGVIRYLLTKLTKEKKQFFEWQVPHNKGIRLTWNYEDWKGERKCTLLQEAPLTAKENG